MIALSYLYERPYLRQHLFVGYRGIAIPVVPLKTVQACTGFYAVDFHLQPICFSLIILLFCSALSEGESICEKVAKPSSNETICRTSE